jgi:guanosine-3',5'-bis(diphosphate) 3'-pyrophosphohydrolase
MTVVERTLPWQDLPNEPADFLAPVVDAYVRRHPGASADVIERAFAVANHAHRDQVRRSGEAYIHHPLAVATIVAELGLDEVTIAAALLHDAVEDTEISYEDVERDFGAVVAEIVDGVTKLDRVSFESKEAQQAATMRKMLVAMARDWRVLIIKLADRLHNMRTLGAMREDKAKRIAQETLDIYAPLAHRLGMQEIKWQLEDLAFSTLHPRRYAEIAQMVANRTPEREEYLTHLIDDVHDRLVDLHITGEVKGRPKHLWSIYEKMVVKGKEFEEIHDLVGIRILVDSVKDCYAALGSIHAQWKPVQGRFKDYVAMPKFNLYQSLHTTVIGPGGKAIEVQIRTYEMHIRAELGIAAHWSYKERKGASEAAGSSETPWLQRIVDWQQDTVDPAEFLESLKLDLEQDEVFVFTPKGDVQSLAVGATPIDFAYAVHTDVGHRCIGARINGRLSPLDSKLVSGDTVERRVEDRRHCQGAQQDSSMVQP